jgi:multiple sugar transport system substrate-binding protein
LPPGVTTWDNTMNNSTYQSGKAVFILNPVTVSLWLEANNPELLAKTAHFTYPRGPKGQIHPVNYGSRSILKYTKVPDVAKQFLADSMEHGKMATSVSQWGPVLKSPAFDARRRSRLKGWSMPQKGELEGHRRAPNDAWREQATNTTTSRMLQRIVVDNWPRDKPAEMVDVTKIYGKYA